MKSVAALVILSCLCMVNSEFTTKWGNTYGRILGTETVSAEGAHSQYQVRAITYPMVNLLFENYSLTSLVTNIESFLLTGISESRSNHRNQTF